ncbi:clathrin-adaptor gamma chain [Pelomyxa schiedti]|nr:clathrin-adaptor gamma chain [Pelomyxa schiedti]
MATKLRDLIKQVRACRTAAEERAVIARECADIRNSFTGDSSNRTRNVAKLLYIQMLGYPTQFGQMECLKLIVSPHYSDKRIGYMGLMLLLDETSEVLTLATNTIQNDLNSMNQFIVGLALTTLGNIASTGIAQDCGSEVDKLLSSPNSYIRKKAGLAAIKVVRKCPQLAEVFLPKIGPALNEKHHGVLLSFLTLILELCESNPQNANFFRDLAQPLVLMLKSLVQSGYAPEHDVNGVTDPFLQVKILRVLRVLGHGNHATTEQMRDVLAQVATNTESARNVGNAILYEGVQTIMGIEAEPGLRVLAVNILGRFLVNPDNNMRYVALNSLNKFVDADVNAVQRHREVIVECLKDPDLSIRKRALELIYALVNENNVRILVRELLNFLIVSDLQFRPDIVAKLCWVAEKFAPNKRWYFDTILRVLSIAGNFVPDEVPSMLSTVVCQTPDLQAYAVQKLYQTLVKDKSQATLQQVTLWCVGEYGDLLVSDPAAVEPGDDPLQPPTQSQVIDLIEGILKTPYLSCTIQEYALTALMKLTSRFDESNLPRLRGLIDKYKTSVYLELQQRSCEYSNLFKWNKIRTEVVARLPPPEEKETSSSAKDPLKSPLPAPKEEIISLIGDVIKGVKTESAQPSLSKSVLPETTPAKPPTTSGNILSALFGGPVPSTTTPIKPSTVTASLIPPTTIIPTPTPAVTPTVLPTTIPSVPVAVTTPTPTPAINTSVQAHSTQTAAGTLLPVFQKNGLVVSFMVSHPVGQPQVYNITATLLNSSSTPMTEFNLKAAVPKWLKLQISPASDTTLPASSMKPATQLIKLANTQHGQSPVLMKLRFEYTVNGIQTAEAVDLAFPPGI